MSRTVAESSWKEMPYVSLMSSRLESIHSLFSALTTVCSTVVDVSAAPSNSVLPLNVTFALSSGRVIRRARDLRPRRNFLEVFRETVVVFPEHVQRSDR